jgi:dienelactone hydrolase
MNPHRLPLQPGGPTPGTAPRLRARRVAAVVLLAVSAGAVAAVIASVGGQGDGARRHGSAGPVRPRALPGARAKPTSPPSSFAVGLKTVRLLDTSRTITLPSGAAAPRPLLTIVRYPALGAASGTDAAGAPAARGDGPFPLIVFGHGFAVTPAPYKRLLDHWARAGFVVAAPVFPLENANAAGAPNEADLVNEPADMSFVISRMIRASAARSGALAGLINPREVAVAGQSDGGDAALAAAYEPRFRDTLIGAAVILSGAEIPGEVPISFPAGGPPLLATQGTADTINTPAETERFFSAARSPKYLLLLPGAEHLPPYTVEQPQLGIVERLSTAFLDGYLKHHRRSLARLVSLGTVPGRASLRVVR